MAPTLDHIVILLPASQLRALPAWLTNEFTVLNGGQHADGVTANKLILFQDGVYIELIAFVDENDDTRRRSHRWGARPDGHIIDWALGLPQSLPAADEAFQAIQSRVRAADAGLVYSNLVSGGRTTPEGVVLKWATSSAAVLEPDGVAGARLDDGALPFWCLDRTDRRLRVPYASDGGRLAQHSSGVIGVAGVTLYVADAALFGQLKRIYSAILAKDEQAELQWELAVPAPSLLHKMPPHLKLVLLKEGQAQGHGWIELSLFTTGQARHVVGSFVDGWRIDFCLQPISPQV